MSQYPPYQPPTVPYGYGYYPQDPLEVLLRPAKRASIFMFIMGGLLIPCGGLILLASGMDFNAMAAGPQQAQFQMLESQLSSLGYTLAGILRVMGLIIGLPGVLFILLGVFVRGGGLGSVITSLIYTGLLTLLVGFIVVSGIVQTVGQQRGEMVIGLCVWMIPLALLVITFSFLIQATKNAGQISQARQGGYGGGWPQQPQQPPQQQQWQQPWPGQQPGQWGGGQQNWPPPPPPQA